MIERLKRENLFKTIDEHSNHLDKVDLSLVGIAINPRIYGAVCDGVTDDTTAIQHALDSVTGGIVIIPSGTTVNVRTITINTDNTVLTILGKLKCDNVIVKGYRSGIRGYGCGTVEGKLKVAKVTVQANSNTNQVTFDNMPFVIGDTVKSSYGIGDDNTNIAITGINGNTITLANNVTANIPIGAYVGNYSWGSLVALQGKESFVDGVRITKSKGYAVLTSINGQSGYIRSIRPIIKNCTFEYNGLDTIYIGDCETAIIENCYFGRQYDCAKQSISIDDKSDLVVRFSIFNTGSNDADFYITKNQTGLTRIKVSDCRFIGDNLANDPFPAPYNTGHFACVYVEADTVNKSLDSIEFESCEFNNYAVLVKGSNRTIYNINRLIFRDCNIIKSLLADFTYLTINTVKLYDCVYDEVNKYIGIDTYYHIGGNTGNRVSLNNCEFKNCGSRLFFSYTDIVNCKIINATKVSLSQSTVINGLYLKESSAELYGTWDTLHRMPSVLNGIVIDNSQFFSSLSNVFFANTPYGYLFPFSTPNGIREGHLCAGNGNIFYYIERRIVNNVSPQFMLYGDEWYFPLNSVLKFNGSTKYVTKSNKTTTTSVSTAGATTITVASTTGFAINDVINIALDSGRVHTTTISAITGSSLTLAVAIPTGENISSGNNVCAFLYS